MKTNQELLEIAETALRELLHRNDHELEGMPRAHSTHAIAHLREAQRALHGHTDILTPLQTAKLHTAMASPQMVSAVGSSVEPDKTLLLDVLETTKLFVQSHPHDRHYMARILKSLGMLAPDRYPPHQVTEWVTRITA